MWGNLSGSDNKVMNNIFQTADGVPLIIDWTPGGGVSFLNNVYYSSGSTFTIRWGGVDYHSLADWRNAVGQETLNSLAIGLAIDPRLLAPGTGGTIDTFVKLEGPTRRIMQRVLISGDFFVTPPRIIFDLEAHLAGTRIDEIDTEIEQFFADNGIEMLSVAPEDFQCSIARAIREGSEHV